MDYFHDALGTPVYVGNRVAFAARDGNSAQLKFAEVVSIEYETGREFWTPKVGVRSHSYTGYGSPTGQRVAYPNIDHMVRLDFNG